jgi:fatty acid desaturase
MNPSSATASKVDLPPNKRGTPAIIKYAGTGVVLAAFWWVVYSQLAPVAHWLTYRVFGLAVGTHLANSVEFFVFEVPKV